MNLTRMYPCRYPKISHAGTVVGSGKRRGYLGRIAVGFVKST